MDMNRLKKLGIESHAEAIAAQLKELGLEMNQVNDTELMGLVPGAEQRAIAPHTPVDKHVVAHAANKRGRLSAVAQKRATEALQKNGFNSTIAAAQAAAATVENFAEQLELKTADYCSDRLEAVPHNIQARIIEEVAASEPHNFRELAEAINGSLQQLSF